MVAGPNDHIPFAKPMFTGSFYFNIDNVEELWKELQNKVMIVYPIDTFDLSMSEFAIYNNNGYMLQFGEEIENE